MEFDMKVIKITFLCLFLTLGVVVYVNAQDIEAPPRPVNDYFPDEWKTHTSGLGGFSVKFPGTPWEIKKDLETKYGRVVQHITEYGRESFIRYTVNYREFPRSLNEAERKTIIDEERDGLLKSFQGKSTLISDTEIKVSGLPARLFTIEFNEAKFLRVLYVIKGTVHYVLLVETFSRHGKNAMGAENGYEKIAMSFLNSFRLVGIIVDDSDKKTVIGGPIGPANPNSVSENGFDDKSWKEFIDEEKGFSILAIGAFTKSNSTNEVKNLPATTYSYNWETSVASYAVNITDYMVLETSLEAVKESYNKSKELFVSRGWKLISEKDVYLEGYLGREFLFEVNPTLNLKTRVVIAGYRLYQLLFVAPADKKTTKSTSDFFVQTSTKFFDSFRLKKSALAKAEEQISESNSPNPFDRVDFRGKVENSIYTNDFLGFSFKIPENWVIESEDESAFAQEKGFELMSKGNEISKRTEEVVKKNVRHLIGIAKGKLGTPDNTNLNIFVERLPLKSISPDVYAKISMANIKESLNNIESVGEIKKRNISGKEFAVFEVVVNLNNQKAKIQVLTTIIKGVSLGLVFTNSSEKDLEILDKIIQSITIK